MKDADLDQKIMPAGIAPHSSGKTPEGPILFRALLGHPVVKLALMAAALALLMTWAEERMYWPWMLSAYVIAAAFYFMDKTLRSDPENPGLLAYFFPREVWLHESATHDYILSIINFFLIIYVLTPLAFSPVFTGAITLKFLHLLALAKAGAPPPAWAVGAYIVLALVLSDFFYYFCHRLTHEIPLLWEFHKVHHSAEVLTPVTVYRMHPVDLWMNQSSRALGLGIAGGIFLYFYPTIDTTLAVAGIDAGILAMFFVAANLRHSHVWISFGPKVERFILSPALHQIHHSDNPKHFDKNYGSLLSVWDWMFGSLYLPKGREHLTFGLRRGHKDPVNQSVSNLYFLPLKKLWHSIIGSAPASAGVASADNRQSIASTTDNIAGPHGNDQ